MAPHPVLLLANLFSEQTHLGSIVPKTPSKSQGEFVDRNFSFKWGVSPLQRRPEKSRERKECTVPVAAHGASSFEQRVERAVAAICLTKLRQLSQLRPRLCSILVSAAHKHQRRFDYTCKLVAPLRETLQTLVLKWVSSLELSGLTARLIWYSKHQFQCSPHSENKDSKFFFKKSTCGLV